MSKVICRTQVLQSVCSWTPSAGAHFLKVDVAAVRQWSCYRAGVKATAEAGRHAHRSTDATGCTDDELLTPRNRVAAYSAPAMLNTSLMLERLVPTCAPTQHGRWRSASMGMVCRNPTSYIH